MEARTGDEPLELRLLGPVEAVRGDTAVDLGPRRQRAVLARLALDLGHPVSIDRLVDDLWGGRPPEGAVRTLRSYLSRLRVALGPGAGIVRRPAGYVLELAPDAVDATRFERAAAEGRALLERRNPRAAAARLRAAVALWRGEPLAGLPPEPFVVAEAARLDDGRISAVEDLIEAELALGRQAMTVEELEDLLKRHPLRERLWAHLMTALYRAGRQADALEAYRRAHTLLSDELGLEPGDELRRLQREILRHELAPPERGEVPHNLPEPLTTFVGREREIATLSGRLAEDRLVTVVGTGGSGKTRLALESARRLLGRFPDGVWMIELASIRDPQLVARTVAAALGSELAGRPATPDALAEHLERMEALVLLDNCEHVVEAAAVLAERLLTACPALRILATSREPLGVPGEAILELPPLDAPPANADADLERYEAVRLFLDRSHGDAGPEALAAAARVCRELDGLPLAIEIAAAQTRMLSVTEIASRLADRFRLLTYWSRTAVPRHRTLRASLDWSDALLEPEERTLFYRLSVFAGGFTIPAVEAVAPADQPVLSVLRRLVDASLVSLLPGDGPRRFGLLETVRQYAEQRLRATGGLEDATARHARFFAVLADRGRAAVNGPDEAATYEEFDRELANLRAALDRAHRSGDTPLVTRLVRGMARYWRLRGSHEEAETWLRRALASAGEPPGDLAADLRGALGQVLLLRGDGAAARTELTAAARSARDAGLHAQLGECLHWLGMAARARGRLAEARTVLTEALELARATGDAAAASHRLGNLGDVAMTDGRLDDAQRLYDEAWRTIQPAAHGHRVPYLESTARLALARGDLAEARRRATEGLAAAGELGDRVHVALNLTLLALLATHEACPERAAALLAEAVDVGCSSEVWAVAEILDVLGAVLIDLGATEQGVVLLAAAAAHRVRVPPPVPPLRGADVAPAEEAARVRLGDAAFDGAWSRGSAMAAQEALTFARSALEPPAATASAG